MGRGLHSEVEPVGQVISADQRWLQVTVWREHEAGHAPEGKDRLLIEAAVRALLQRYSSVQRRCSKPLGWVSRVGLKSTLPAHPQQRQTPDTVHHRSNLSFRGPLRLSRWLADICELRLPPQVKGVTSAEAEEQV